MRWVFKLLPLALFVFIAAGILRARSLPRERTLEREIIIEAPRTEVYRRLATISGWRGWYVPPGEGRFEGPASGPGATLVIEAEGQTRRLQLTETSSPSFVTYTFPDMDAMPYEIRGTFDLSDLDPRRTRVISRQALRGRAGDSEWMSLAGERWFLSVLADRFVGSILERELHNLKGAIEGLPAPGEPQ